MSPDRHKTKLYWVETADHAEDWFMVAPSKARAARLHEQYEGYGRGDAEASVVARVPPEVEASMGWPTNELLEACGVRIVRNETPRVVESETRLYDIATEDICTYFKPIRPGEEFTFHIEFGAADFGPAISLSKPGRYRLKWIYDAKHYEDEASCADANWPIWKRRLESTEVLTVVE